MNSGSRVLSTFCFGGVLLGGLDALIMTNPGSCPHCKHEPDRILPPQRGHLIPIFLGILPPLAYGMELYPPTV